LDIKYYLYIYEIYINNISLNIKTNLGHHWTKPGRGHDFTGRGYDFAGHDQMILGQRLLYVI
jgi:hypothetical protein